MALVIIGWDQLQDDAQLGRGGTPIAGLHRPNCPKILVDVMLLQLGLACLAQLDHSGIKSPMDLLVEADRTLVVDGGKNTIEVLVIP